MRFQADGALDFVLDAVGLGGRQVDLVQHRHDLEIVLKREIRVRHCLRFDALRRIHN